MKKFARFNKKCLKNAPGADGERGATLSGGLQRCGGWGNSGGGSTVGVSSNSLPPFTP